MFVIEFTMTIVVPLFLGALPECKRSPAANALIAKGFWLA